MSIEEAYFLALAQGDTDRPESSNAYWAALIMVAQQGGEE